MDVDTNDIRELKVMERLLEVRNARIDFAVNHHVNTGGDRMDFSSFPYLKGLYNSLAKTIVLQGSVQSFKSEFLIVDTLANAYSGMSVFFVLPKVEMRNTYVQNRINRVVGSVPLYKTIVGEGFFDSVQIKQFGRGIIKFVGSGSFSDMREYPSSCMAIVAITECLENGQVVKKKISEVVSGDVIKSFSCSTKSLTCSGQAGKMAWDKVVVSRSVGRLPLYRVRLANGGAMTCTLGHQFYTSEGWRYLYDIISREEAVHYPDGSLRSVRGECASDDFGVYSGGQFSEVGRSASCIGFGALRQAERIFRAQGREVKVCLSRNYNSGALRESWRRKGQKGQGRAGFNTVDSQYPSLTRIDAVGRPCICERSEIYGQENYFQGVGGVSDLGSVCVPVYGRWESLRRADNVASSELSKDGLSSFSVPIIGVGSRGGIEGTSQEEAKKWRSIIDIASQSGAIRKIHRGDVTIRARGFMVQVRSGPCNISVVQRLFEGFRDSRSGSLPSMSEQELRDGDAAGATAKRVLEGEGGGSWDNFRRGQGGQEICSWVGQAQDSGRAEGGFEEGRLSKICGEKGQEVRGVMGGSPGNQFESSSEAHGGAEGRGQEEGSSQGGRVGKIAREHRPREVQSGCQAIQEFVRGQDYSRRAVGHKTHREQMDWEVSEGDDRRREGSICAGLSESTTQDYKRKTRAFDPGGESCEQGCKQGCIFFEVQGNGIEEEVRETGGILRQRVYSGGVEICESSGEVQRGREGRENLLHPKYLGVQALTEDGFIGIESVEFDRIDEAWDLQTENTNAYFADGVLSHNCLVVEEVTECDQQNLKYAEDRLSGSIYRFKRFAGNPTIKEFGINRYFLTSDQREWRVPCRSCGKHAPLDWFASVVREIRDKSGQVIDYKLRDTEWTPGCGRDIVLVCPHCSGALERVSSKGVWVPTFDSPIEGYHVSKLHNDINSVASMWMEFSGGWTNQLTLQRFFNSGLGLPYNSSGSKVSDDLIQKCCENYEFHLESDRAFLPPSAVENPCIMGVDVGATLDVRVDEILPSGKRKMVFVGKLRTAIDSIAEVVSSYGVQMIVIDHGPEMALVRDLKDCDLCETWSCLFRQNEGRDGRESYDSIDFVITGDRTELLDRAFNHLKDGHVIFPSNVFELLNGAFAEEVANPVRQITLDKKGRARYEWSSSGPDHQRLADCYAFLAYKTNEGNVISSISII
jgi:hypothetical protein